MGIYGLFESPRIPNENTRNTMVVSTYVNGVHPSLSLDTKAQLAKLPVAHAGQEAHHILNKEDVREVPAEVRPPPPTGGLKEATPFFCMGEKCCPKYACVLKSLEKFAFFLGKRVKSC